MKFMTPPEKIVARNPLITMFNADRMLRTRKFIVDLACGHKIYTPNRNTAVCPRCSEMLRRSIADGKEDYDSFRKGLRGDTMSWPADPCRQFNERSGED